MKPLALLLLLVHLLVSPSAYAQERHYNANDFSPAEFAERRGKVLDAIGKQAIAVVQAADMRRFLEGKTFKDASHAKAAQDALAFRGHFQHSTGLMGHDVGTLRGVKLREGMVFTIDPMVWLHDQRLYLRIEDVARVTADGVENLSAFVPSAIADVERCIAQEGLLQQRPELLRAQ